MAARVGGRVAPREGAELLQPQRHVLQRQQQVGEGVEGLAREPRRRGVRARQQRVQLGRAGVQLGTERGAVGAAGEDGVEVPGRGGGVGHGG